MNQSVSHKPAALDTATKAKMVADLVASGAAAEDFIALTDNNALQLRTSELLTHAIASARTEAQFDVALAGVRAAYGNYGHDFKIRVADNLPILRGGGRYMRLLHAYAKAPEAIDLSGLSSSALEQIMSELQAVEV